MNKYIYSALGIAALASLSSCEDFLEAESPSVVDAEFVFSNSTTARAAMEGAYEQWRSTANSYVFGAGLFYASDIAGSDYERHPEGYSNQVARHIPECFYENGAKTSSYDIDSYSSNGNTGAYSYLYDCIGKSNAIITAMKGLDSYHTIITNATSPTPLSQLFGEAVALRATAYRELIKYYGDVPYVSVFGVPAGGLTARDSIYDVILADLQLVEPLMYPIGSIPSVSASAKNYFSQTYVDGLIGRIALEAAGFQTRRSDINYVDGKGNAIKFEQLGLANSAADNAFYARREDWKDLYAVAKTYYGKAIEHAGSAKFYTKDPRSKGGKGQVYDNPFQYFFQQMMDADAAYADESIYEYPMQQNVASDERTYSSGRASGGGKAYNFPCKNYGQARITPIAYYGYFDPKDKRRDVTACVTGSTGKGVESLIPFAMGSTIKGGGITLNKWDENRQKSPNVIAQRKSGINGPYMRMSEILLGYAEACAVCGDETTALEYLKMVRERSFPDGEANTDAFVEQCGSLYPSSGLSKLAKAIIEERGFEFAGEGDRRFTLIRTGLLPEAIKRAKELTKAMIDGLEANGSYTFANGNVISNKVYTKLVDCKSSKLAGDVDNPNYVGYRLTTQCTDETNPVLFPGWRGQNDNWEDFDADKNQNKFSYGTSYPATNLAIQGLFAPVADEAALLADGYKATDWGNKIVANKAEYYDYFFTNYDYVSAPVYLWPIAPNAVSTGGFHNGYGFQDE